MISIYSPPVTPEHAVQLIGRLTGRARGRGTRFGNVMLQVEYWKWVPTYGFGPITVRNPYNGEQMLGTEWRDAKPDDLAMRSHFGEQRPSVTA